MGSSYLGSLLGHVPLSFKHFYLTKQVLNLAGYALESPWELKFFSGTPSCTLWIRISGTWESNLFSKNSSDDFGPLVDLNSRTSHITDSSPVTQSWILKGENLIDSTCPMSVLVPHHFFFLKGSCIYVSSFFLVMDKLIAVFKVYSRRTLVFWVAVKIECCWIFSPKSQKK